MLMGLLQQIFGSGREKDPLIITDFCLVDGGLYLDIINVSDIPAHNVCHECSHPIPSVGGSRNLAELPVMRNVPFMAPRKHIRLFVDPIETFLHFWQEEQLRIRTIYKSPQGASCRMDSVHDPRILGGLPPTSSADFYHH